MTTYNIPVPTITEAGDRRLNVVWQTPEKDCTYSKREKGTASSLTPEKDYIAKAGGASHAYMSGYDVTWNYTTQASNGEWLFGGVVGVPQRDTLSAVITAPDDALRVRVRVKPRATTYTTWTYASAKNSNGSYTYSWTSKTAPYFTAGVGYWAAYNFAMHAPAVPNVSAETNEAGTKAFVTVQSSDLDAATFDIAVKKDGYLQKDTYTTASGLATIVLDKGVKYEFKARAVTVLGAASDWSAYSAPIWSAVSAPAIESVKAIGLGTAAVKCTAVPNAALYRVRYAKTKELIKGGSFSTATSTGSTVTVQGLDNGEKYWFQAQCESKGGVETSWSAYESGITGTAPSSPLPFVPSYHVTVADAVTVTWEHNSTDGSEQTDAEIRWEDNEIEFDDPRSGVIQNLGNAHSYTFDRSDRDNCKLRFGVRTKGAAGLWSPWSAWRLVTFYPVPTVSVDTPELLTTLPLGVSATAQTGIASSKPIGYSMRLVSMDGYTYRTADGEQTVNPGDAVWSEDAKTSAATCYLRVDPGEAHIENGARYYAEVETVFSSGLSKVATGPVIDVAFDYSLPEPDAFLTEANDSSMAVRPVCRTVSQMNPTTGEVMSWDYASAWLDVYRVNADGSVELVAANVKNNSTVLDVHPTFNAQHYRIVATSKVNGTQSFAEAFAEAVECESVLLQWDESWSDGASMSSYLDDEYTGMALELPYNIGIAESYRPDKVLVQYIGRSHPVLYTGTQKGQTASATFDVPRDDEETVELLRHLAAWDGPVYARTPNGLGWWASADVSMSTNAGRAAYTVTVQLARIDKEA